MKVDVELLLVYEIEKEEVDEKEHDDEAWIEQKDEFYGGYHVRERQQNDGRQSKQNVEQFVEQLVVVGWVRFDRVDFLRLLDYFNLKMVSVSFQLNR